MMLSKYKDQQEGNLHSISTFMYIQQAS